MKTLKSRHKFQFLNLLLYLHVFTQALCFLMGTNVCFSYCERPPADHSISLSLETWKYEKKGLFCPLFNTYSINRLLHSFSDVSLLSGEALLNFSRVSKPHDYKTQTILIWIFFPLYLRDNHAFFTCPSITPLRVDPSFPKTPAESHLLF